MLSLVFRRGLSPSSCPGCINKSLSLFMTNQMSHNLRFKSFSAGNLLQKIVPKRVVSLVISRSILTMEHAPQSKLTKVHRKDNIGPENELIYSAPSYLGLKLLLCGALLSATVTSFVICHFLFTDDKEVEEFDLGQFDSVTLLRPQKEELPLYMSVFVLAVACLFYFTTRIPQRIYHMKTQKRKYIAVFVHKCLPWKNSFHSFEVAHKLESNFLHKKIFPLDTYKLGTRKAILFPHSFRCMLDHDEMTNFQSKSFVSEVDADKP